MATEPSKLSLASCNPGLSCVERESPIPLVWLANTTEVVSHLVCHHHTAHQQLLGVHFWNGFNLLIHLHTLTEIK